jgi:hypothetical protein
MALKRNSQPTAEDAGQGSPKLKENAEVNARIDDYIRSNPKRWEYIQSLPPERMARALVLNEIQKEDRREKMRQGVLTKLDQNPELKEHIANLVKNVPEDQRESATVSIATRTMRALKPAQGTGAKI